MRTVRSQKRREDSGRDDPALYFGDDAAPYETEAREIIRKILAWRGTRRFALVLLLVAIVIGVDLRFHRLARVDMNGDEGASWAAASAPTVRQVARIERYSDPGKFALYDVVLHEWIAVFGDSLFAMRAMSATLGVIAIFLLFVAVREIWRSLASEPDSAATSTGELAGAFAALLYATNLDMVLSDRTMRMYPLMMCADLLQIIFFVRAQRRGGILNYAGVAIFTAAMFAANFTSVFLIAAEGVWLGWLLLAKLWDAPSRRLAVFGPGCALATGIAILVPSLAGGFVSSQRAVSMEIIDWIKQQPVWWPYTTLKDSIGSDTLFWIFVALAVFGVWRKWRSGRVATQFVAVWMTVPLLAIMAVSYCIHPLEFPRYVFISFVGMFAFAAIGAASVRSAVFRMALVVLVLYLSVGPVRYQVAHPYEAAWRDAIQLAKQLTPQGEKVAIYPYYNINVVRFYMPPERRDAAVGMDDKCGQAPVLILTGRDMIPKEELATVEACYPRLVAAFKLVEVRGR
jgi:hypothetical protein